MTCSKGLQFEALGQIMTLLLVTPCSLVRGHAGSVGRGSFAILMQKCFAVCICWTAHYLLAQLWCQQDTIYNPPSHPRQTTCSGMGIYWWCLLVCVWSGFEARPSGFTSFNYNTEAAVQPFVTTKQYNAQLNFKNVLPSNLPCREYFSPSLLSFRLGASTMQIAAIALILYDTFAQPICMPK